MKDWPTKQLNNRSDKWPTSNPLKIFEKSQGAFGNQIPADSGLQIRGNPENHCLGISETTLSYFCSKFLEHELFLHGPTHNTNAWKCKVTMVEIIKVRDFVGKRGPTMCFGPLS